MISRKKGQGERERLAIVIRTRGTLCGSIRGDSNVQFCTTGTPSAGQLLLSPLRKRVPLLRCSIPLLWINYNAPINYFETQTGPILLQFLFYCEREISRRRTGQRAPLSGRDKYYSKRLFQSMISVAIYVLSFTHRWKVAADFQKQKVEFINVLSLGYIPANDPNLDVRLRAVCALVRSLSRLSHSFLLKPSSAENSVKLNNPDNWKILKA